MVYDALQWRHNEGDGLSNHQPHDCLLNRVFGRRTKTTSKLRVTSLCAGNSPATSEFPAQMASNVSILMTSSCHGLHMCCVNPIQMFGDVNSGTSRHPIKRLIRKSRESQSRESSRLLSNHIALEFSKRFGTRAAEMAVIVKLQTSISRLRKIALSKFLSHNKISYAILKQPGWSGINWCLCPRSRHQGQEQVITFHSVCGV